MILGEDTLLCGRLLLAKSACLGMERLSTTDNGALLENEDQMRHTVKQRTFGKKR